MHHKLMMTASRYPFLKGRVLTVNPPFIRRQILGDQRPALLTCGMRLVDKPLQHSLTRPRTLLQPLLAMGITFTIRANEAATTVLGRDLAPM